MEFGS